MLKKLTCLMIVLMLISGCSENKKDLGSLNEISATQALHNMEDKKDMILVIGTSTCEGCIEYVALIKEYIKDYNTDFSLVEIDNEPIVKDEKGNESRPTFMDLQKKIGSIAYTPTTYFIEDGEILSEAGGAANYEELLNLMKEHGFAKK
ncbi:MAG: hypothetical protein RR524_03595 [Erysipelotrichaceae bacterium]